MNETTAPKKNRLTLYIIIALIIGIALGFVLNGSYVVEENKTIAKTEKQIKQVNTQLSGLQSDTLSSTFSELKAQKEVLLKENKNAHVARDKKLEPFSILADIFLRLIKMIVAPLVFTTLVVGVAKLGDIKSVGRIGGKTLLWFMVASFTSLLLGMMLVNFFKPGINMHLPLPVTDETGITKTALSLKDFL
ncbi:MAG TPA: cation:dicarboxylase symporter family transporter, partial [Flavipsychrobacter sp.]|nr:cation:dicarboxylase symporter family transporter [Flavipsychrobacter sp.]